MIENLAHNREEIFNEVKERAREEGAYSKEAWDDLVEEVIEEHRSVGEMHDDEDLMRLKDEVQERFGEFSQENP